MLKRLAKMLSGPLKILENKFVYGEEKLTIIIKIFKIEIK